MTRRQLTADHALTLLQRRSQNTHVKLRTIAQTVIQTGDLPVGTEVRPDDTAPTTQPTPASTAGQSDTVANAHTSPAVTTISVRGACEIQRQRLDLIRAADI